MHRTAVIISTYNNPSYLKRVLDGYLLQSVMPDEVIIADDGSTEETAEMIQAHPLGLRIKLQHIWHEDTGFRLAAIRNRAVSSTDAGYLIFSDGDCVPDERFVEDHNQLRRSGCFVTGKRILVGQNASHTFERSDFRGLFRLWLSGELKGMHHLLHLPSLFWQSSALSGIRGCNLAMFRSDLMAVNGFNESFNGWGREDSELVLRLFNLGLKRIVPPCAALVFHLWHRENDRTSLAENDRILSEVRKSGTDWCSNGIIKGMKEAQAAGHVTSAIQ